MQPNPLPRVATPQTPAAPPRRPSPAATGDNPSTHPGRTLVHEPSGVLLVPSLHNWERPRQADQCGVARLSDTPFCCSGRVVQGPLPTGHVLSCCVVSPKLVPVQQRIEVLEAQAESAEKEIKIKAQKAREEVAAVFKEEVGKILNKTQESERQREEMFQKRFWGAVTDQPQSKANIVIEQLPCRPDGFHRIQFNQPSPHFEFGVFKIPKRLSTSSKYVTSEQNVQNFQKLSQIQQAQIRTFEEARSIQYGRLDVERSRIGGEILTYEPDIPNRPDVKLFKPNTRDTVRPTLQSRKVISNHQQNIAQPEQVICHSLLAPQELELPNYSNALAQRNQPVSYEQLLEFMKQSGSGPMEKVFLPKESPRQIQTVSFYTPEAQAQPTSATRTEDVIPTNTRNQGPSRAIMIYEPTEDYLIEDLSSRNNTSKPSLFVSASNFLKTEPQEAHQDQLQHTKDWQLGKSTHFTSESLSKVALAASENDLLRSRYHEENPEFSANPPAQQSARPSKRATFASAKTAAAASAVPSNRAAPKKPITPIYLYRRHDKRTDPWRLGLLTDLLGPGPN